MLFRSWFDELSLQDKNRFAKIIRYAESIGMLRDLPQKVIGGYTNQPSGYNGIPMIVYGKFTKAGRVAPNGWFLRIPQPTSKNTSLTLFIPQCFSASKVDTTWVSKHGSGSQEFFYPISTDHFLDFPEAYVDWNKPDTRSV